MRHSKHWCGSWALLLAVLGIAAPPGSRSATDTTTEPLVFAAASLAAALTEVARAFSADGGGSVAFNFAASNDLSRQILAGAPADLFLSANRAQVDRLVPSARVSANSIVAFLGNSLVVVVPTPSAQLSLLGAEDLLRFDRLAMADPAGVPAGIYAREWLEQVGLWQRLAPRIAPALDARAAVAAVASANLPAGVVYATDAQAQPRVRVVYRVPPAEGPKIRYWAALVTAGPAPQPAAAFLAFLTGEQAAAIFQRHGFVTTVGKE